MEAMTITLSPADVCCPATYKVKQKGFEDMHFTSYGDLTDYLSGQLPELPE